MSLEEKIKEITNLILATKTPSIKKVYEGQLEATALQMEQAEADSIEGVDLAVIDDGIGFDLVEGLSVANLLVHKHFGLVGMMERARSVGAELEVESHLGQGTSIRVRWEAAL